MHLTPEQVHDLLMLVAWPLVTAGLNAVVALAGHSDHPLAKVLAAVGTSLLSSTKAAKK